MKSIEAMWHLYINELVEKITRKATAILPQIPDYVPDLKRVFEEMQLEAQRLLSYLSRSSSKIQPEFRDALQDCLTPSYRQALDIKGPGSFKRRHNYLQQHVVEYVRCIHDLGDTEEDSDEDDEDDDSENKDIDMDEEGEEDED